MLISIVVLLEVMLDNWAYLQLYKCIILDGQNVLDNVKIWFMGMC